MRKTLEELLEMNYPTDSELMASLAVVEGIEIIEEEKDLVLVVDDYEDAYRDMVFNKESRFAKKDILLLKTTLIDRSACQQFIDALSRILLMNIQEIVVFDEPGDWLQELSPNQTFDYEGSLDKAIKETILHELFHSLQSNPFYDAKVQKGEEAAEVFCRKESTRHRISILAA